MEKVCEHVFPFNLFPCKVWSCSSSLVLSICGQTFTLQIILFCVCSCPSMPLQVSSCCLSPFSLGYSNLHPSAGPWSCHSFASSCIVGLGLDSHLFPRCILDCLWGLSPFLSQDLMVPEPLLLLYKLNQSAVRVPLIQKLHGSQEIPFSQIDRVSIVVTCC